jgi:hypothetical protein
LVASVAVLVVVVVVLGVPVAVVNVVEVVIVRHCFVAAVDPVNMVRVFLVVLPVRVSFAAAHVGDPLDPSRRPSGGYSNCAASGYPDGWQPTQNSVYGIMQAAKNVD